MIYEKERFMLAPSGVYVRDMKHLGLYVDIDDIIDLMNNVNKFDNCAVDIIEKELKEQEDENGFNKNIGFDKKNLELG